jgi:hypothetical protein
MHDVDGRIVEQRLIVTVAPRDTETLRALPGGLVVRPGKSDDVDEPQATHRIDVVRSNETRADKAHPDARGGTH